jgi:hypothetical protein
MWRQDTTCNEVEILLISTATISHRRLATFDWSQLTTRTESDTHNYLCGVGSGCAHKNEFIFIFYCSVFAPFAPLPLIIRLITIQNEEIAKK